MHRMMNMHTKYDNLHLDDMNCALKYTNNYINSSIGCMLSFLKILIMIKITQLFWNLLET